MNNGYSIKINSLVFYKISGNASVGVQIGSGCLNVIIYNSIFVENCSGGAIYSDNNNAKYVNCTFVNNRSNGVSPAGIYNWNDPKDTVINCIIYSNRNASGKQYAQLTFGHYIYHSDIEDKDSGGIYQIIGDTINVIDKAPLFEYQKDSVNLYPAGADGVWFTKDDGLRLQSGSPCREKGNFFTWIPAFDILGRTRPNENYPDIGAYEYYQ